MFAGGVLLMLLAGASVVSWAIILRKRRVLREASEAADEFEEGLAVARQLLALAERQDDRGLQAAGLEPPRPAAPRPLR